MSVSRSHTLDTLSEIVMPNGHVTRKLDFLGIVSIYERHYFNVWRRYNNVYEIVFEDFHGDFHFHKNYTVSESVQKILCLSDEQIRGLYTVSAISFKHRADIYEDITSMRWTEIQHRWYALEVTLGGIMNNIHNDNIHNENTDDVDIDDNDDDDEVPRTPPTTTISIPNAPIADRNVFFLPAATPVRLTDRFTQIDDFTLLRNGTKIAKPRH